MKNLKILSFFFAFTLLFLANSASAASNNQNHTVLAVDGQGSSQAKPDQVTITIGVTNTNTDANKAQQTNANTSANVNQAIKLLGIEAKDIQTDNYSFRPIYHSDEKHVREISGYTVNNSIVAVIHDINKTGKVIDTALNAGANEITSIDFSVSNTKLIRKAAMQKAVADARDKADIIAASFGKRIIGIQSISESTGDIEARPFNRAMLLASKASDTPIEPGNLSLMANVHVEFILSD